MRVSRPSSHLFAQSLLALALAGFGAHASAAQNTSNDCVPPAETDDADNRTPTKPVAPTRRHPNAPGNRGNTGESTANPRSTRWQSFVPGMFR